MLLPENHYPQFSDVTTLEGLVLQLGREILEIQKDSAINTANVELIDIDPSEKDEIVDITTSNWTANWNNGLLVINNPFPNHSFTTGTGTYPFNQSTLVNAFFHVVMFLHKQELSVSKNVALKQCASFSIISVTEIGDPQQLEVSITIEDLPISINNTSNATTTTAKPYLV